MPTTKNRRGERDQRGSVAESVVMLLLAVVFVGASVLWVIAQFSGS